MKNLKRVITLLNYLKDKNLTQTEIRKLTGISERSQRRYLNQPQEIKEVSKKTIFKAGLEAHKISADKQRSYVVKTFHEYDTKEFTKFFREHKERFVWFDLGIKYKMIVQGKVIEKVFVFRTATDTKSFYKSLLKRELKRLLKMLQKNYKIISYQVIYYKAYLTDFT